MTTSSGTRTTLMKEDTIPTETASEHDIEDLEITREAECIDFEIGDNVVYPHHGAGQVIKKEEKEILGEVRQYLTIKILHNDMTVMVPCENAGKAGLRRVIDEETVKKVLAVLSDDVSEMPKNWNRRFKHNRDKIKTGDIYELAEVVRNLAVREQDKGLSTGEKQMYTRAKKILASEMMYALEKSEDEAEAYLDDLLDALGRSWRPPPPRASAAASDMAVALLVAAGSGERLGADRPKAFVVLAGRPMLEWSLDALRAAGIDDVVVALPGRAGRRRAGVHRRAGRRDPLGVGARGARRRAAAATPSWSTTRRGRWSTPELFTAALAALADADCAIAAAPVTDTIKEAGPDRLVTRHARPLAAVGDPDPAGVPPRRARARARRRRRRARPGDRRRLARRAHGRHACGS